MRRCLRRRRRRHVGCGGRRSSRRRSSRCRRSSRGGLFFWLRVKDRRRGNLWHSEPARLPFGATRVAQLRRPLWATAPHGRLCLSADTAALDRAVGVVRRDVALALRALAVSGRITRRGASVPRLGERRDFALRLRPAGGAGDAHRVAVAHMIREAARLIVRAHAVRQHVRSRHGFDLLAATHPACE